MATRNDRRANKTRPQRKQRRPTAPIPPELADIRNELVGARNVAATVCLALPHADSCRKNWEIANTLYECVVRILDRQLDRLKWIEAGRQP